MAPKKQKQSLADFLADPKIAGSVDWADDLDDLPTGPLTREDRGPPRRTSDWLSSQPDRADRADRYSGTAPVDPARYATREELPLPTAPPFTSFVGNLSFEVTELDVQDFFAPLNTTSVRLVNGPDGRPKGFGYVEFATLEDLKGGLARSNAQMNGRSVRVSVAESRDAKGSGFNSVAEEATQWRRAAPLPPSDPSGGRHGSDRPGYGRYESSSGGGGGGGFDGMDVGPDGRSGFGSRFTASAPRPPRQPESLEPTVGDNASDWRTGKPVSDPAALRRSSAGPRGAPSGASGTGSRFGDATEVDEKYSSQERLGFGSKFVATPPESPSMNKRPGFGFDRRSNNSSAAGPTQGGVGGGGGEGENWRSARRTSGQSHATGQASSGSPNGNAEPAQRKKLELKPRSANAGESNTSAASVTSPTASNPFGAARPVDATEREREIEAKMAQREKERKEEERVRREKREKSTQDGAAPTGPKSDRIAGAKSSGGQASASTRNGSGNAGARQRGASKSSPAPAEKTANGGGVSGGNSGKGAPNDGGDAGDWNVVSSRKTSVTGAWGAGRKASGALSTPQEGQAAAEAKSGVVAEQTQNVNGSVADDKAVTETTKAVEAIDL